MKAILKHIGEPQVIMVHLFQMSLSHITPGKDRVKDAFKYKCHLVTNQGQIVSDTMSILMHLRSLEPIPPDIRKIWYGLIPCLILRRLAVAGPCKAACDCQENATKRGNGRKNRVPIDLMPKFSATKMEVTASSGLPGKGLKQFDHMEGIQAKLEQKGFVRGRISESGSRTIGQSSSAQSILTRAELTRQQWNVIDLEQQRKGWEEIGLQIAGSQEAGNTSRKNLAESTKAFKKLTDEEKLQQWGTLLKSYQSEVDLLTKRSKLAESSMLNVYKLFQDVLDPSDIIESLCEELRRLMALETNHDKVLKELLEYKEEFATLKNQEVTIRNLQDQNQALQLQFQQKLEEAVELAISEENQKIEADIQRERKELLDRIQQAEQLLRQEKSNRRELQSTYDELQASHLSTQTAFEEQLSARDAQIALLSDEVERSGLRAAALEKEKEQINQQYLDLWKKQYGTPAEVSGALPPSAAARLSELEAAVQSKDAQLKQVTLQVDILQETLDRERSAFALMSQDSSRQLQHKTEELLRVQREVAQLPSAADVARLKRQLRMMQAVQYNLVDAELVEDPDSPDSGGAWAEQRRLEEALMNKNQLLETKLNDMRRAAEAAAVQMQELERVVAAQADSIRR